MAASRRIGLFGGTFDPPHFGHAIALRHALDEERMDEIWVVPSGTRRDKDPGASPQERLTMTQLFLSDLFGEHPRIAIQEHLINNPDIAFTVDELALLTREHSNRTFTVIIGSDQSRVLKFWHEPETLAKRAEFLIISRDGKPANVPEGFRAKILDPETTNWVNLSSTDLRKRLAEGKDIHGMTTERVIAYIHKNGLYQH